MGNYISCTLANPMRSHSTRAAKVIFPTGEIRQFHEPIKAAEIMLDTPNSFLVNSNSLHIGRRFSALNADEDLEMANSYVIFSMKRLNSVVTAADLGALFLTAKRGSIGTVRISPEYSEAQENTLAAEPKLILDDIEEFSAQEFKHRLSMCRSKKPMLETIVEESVCLR